MELGIQNPQHKDVLKLESQERREHSLQKLLFFVCYEEKYNTSKSSSKILGLDYDLDHQQNLMECVPTPVLHKISFKCVFIFFIVLKEYLYREGKFSR